MTRKTPKTKEAREYRNALKEKLVNERNKGNKEIAQNLLDQNMTTQEYWSNKFGEHEKIAENRMETHKTELEFKKTKKDKDNLDSKKNELEKKTKEAEEKFSRETKEKLINNCYLDFIIKNDPSKTKLIEYFKKTSEEFTSENLQKFYSELIKHSDDDILNSFFYKSSYFFTFRWNDSKLDTLGEYLKTLESIGRKKPYTESGYYYWMPVGGDHKKINNNYEEAQKTGRDLYEKSEEAKNYEKNKNNLEEIIKKQKKANEEANNKNNDLYKIKNKISSLKNDRNFLSSLTPKNLESLIKYEKEYGESSVLRQLVKSNSEFDLEKFIINTPHTFIRTCEIYDMQPCTDGKHQVAIGIKYAPSVNTGAGLQYGNNVSILYDGKIQETKYFKWRDGYSASNDIPSNNFNKILDISVDENTGEVKVIAQAGNYSPKTINFQIEKSNTENEMQEEEKTKFAKKFEIAKTEILKLQTRNTKTALRYNMAYRGDLVKGQDPYQEVAYEEAKIISQAIDYKRGLGAIVISTQIDANANSGRQMGYYAYIIHPNGSKEEVRTDNIYADAIKNGKSVNIPDAKEIIKLYKKR